MLKHLIFFPLFFLLVSCYNENKPATLKPEPLLSEKELVEIITDIQIAEGVIVHHLQNKRKSTDGFKDSIFQVVFDHYGISSKLFRENINYYNTMPKVMEDVYEDVLTNLSKSQSEIQIEAEEKAALKKKEMDSIAEIEEAEHQLELEKMAIDSLNTKLPDSTL